MRLNSNYFHKKMCLFSLRCVGGGIPYAKVGRAVTYKKSDVLAYQNQQTVMNTAQLAS